MKWKAALLNGLGILFAILLVKNACNLCASYAYSRSMNENYIFWVNIAGTAGGLILLVAIIRGLFRAPFTVSAARIAAFALALFIPSHEWPEHEWKIDNNAAHYNALISGVESEPKIVVLEYEEVGLSINGTLYTYIVYDSSGQIELPDQLRSKEWRKALPESAWYRWGSVSRDNN